MNLQLGIISFASKHLLADAFLAALEARENAAWRADGQLLWRGGVAPP